MRSRPPWPILGLTLIGVAALVLAILEIGPPTSSARTAREVVTAQKGVVQSTVTGTGNLAAGTDVEANFQTSGTLRHVDVHPGEHVAKGQLLATLDAHAAQLTVDQAKDNLSAAEDQLTNAQSAASSSSSSTNTRAIVASRAAEFVDLPRTTPTAPATTPTAPATTPSTPTATAPTRGAPTRSAPATTTVTETQTTTAPATRTVPGGVTTGSSGSRSSTASSAGPTTSTTNAAATASSIASARASVLGDEATLRTAENTLHETRLDSPATGTIVSMEGLVPGDAVSASSSSTVSASGSSAGSSSAGSSSSGSSSATGLGGTTGATASGSLGGSGSSSSSAGASSSTGFAEIVNTHTMTMTVAFDESDISELKVGQPATVTLEALTGVELGAHVTAISTVATTSSSVVSYDATLTLDQHNRQVKPGMSASAAVITGQASGVTLPTSAVSGTGSTATLSVTADGKTKSTPVIVGVRGDSRTQIVSGLSAGQQVAVTETLPSLSSSSGSSGSSSSGTLGGTTGGFGGAGGVGGGRFGGGSGFAARLPGGGG